MLPVTSYRAMVYVNMKLPDAQIPDNPEMSWLLNDAALYREGARFIAGQFVITDEQFVALQQEAATPQEVPIEIVDAINPLTAARNVLKEAYLADKAEAVVPQLETDDPNTYLEGIRSFVRSAIIPPTSSEPYVHLQAKPQTLARADAASMRFLPLITDDIIPSEISATALIFVPGQLARQLDRLFTMSSTITKLTMAGESLALHNKPQPFQDAVRDQFLAENIRLLELVTEVGDAEKIELAARSNALFCNSISSLETAIQDFPDIPPAKIVTTFMRQSVHFLQRVQQFQANAEKQAAHAAEAERARQLAAQQKRAKRFHHDVTHMRRSAFAFTLPPLGGERIIVPRPEYITNTLFSGIVSLEESLSAQYGPSTWEAWQLLPEHNPAEEFARFLSTVQSPVQATVLALPTEKAIQQISQKLPRGTVLNPEHAIRLNLACTVGSEASRQYYLIDMLYFATDAETPATRRYRVASSSLMNDKAVIARYLQKLRAYEGDATAHSVQEAFSANPPQNNERTRYSR